MRNAGEKLQELFKTCHSILANTNIIAIQCISDTYSLLPPVQNVYSLTVVSYFLFLSARQ